jgi:hypothetical protein
VVDLPLVVPSLSSKGFQFYRDSESGEVRSETSDVLGFAGSFFQESFLISAFDLHHKHYADPTSYFSNASLILLDSGGYELNPEFDSTEPKITPVRALDFTADEYEKVLDALKSENPDYPLLIANFDWATKNQPFIDQIKAARKLFKRYANWGSNFILKPDTPTSGIVHVERVASIAEELRSFDVIGVTEKELGKGLIERLKRLAKLRLALWDQEISAPIHIWGGMDPLTTPLYYFAGADIFDGVSWLRYAYRDGLAVTLDSGPILRGDIAGKHDLNIALTRSNNLSALQELAVNLRFFANLAEPEFQIFGLRADVLKRAYEVMSAKIPRFKELR